MSWFHNKTVPAPQAEPGARKSDETALTSKPEREACLKHLSLVMSSPERGAVLKLYIENFKRLNQVFGYEYCENLLDQILAYLKEHTKKNVYHYIGVEFIIILDRFTQGQALELGEEIAARFDHVWKAGGTDCLCSVQMGICSYPGHAHGPEQMLKCLDLAVSKAEEGGPNQAVVFDSALQKQLLRRQTIALPVSPVLFLQEDFLSEVKKAMETYGIPRGKLALEIQESALTMAYLNINVMLQQLQEMGVEIILNEFGSGYSGISNILDLPVDTLKLERLFIWQLETNPGSRHIIKGLVRMARDLDLNIIAEGLETENQVQILTGAGCNYQQGFYYSPTLEKDSLLRILGTSLTDSLPVLTEEKEKMSRN
ncbi:EAL domain-containing protein [Lachnospiraceae bacterium 54-53]